MTRARLEVLSKVWIVAAMGIGAAIATPWTGACTTVRVNFAIPDGGASRDLPHASTDDASSVDALSVDASADTSTVDASSADVADTPTVDASSVDGPRMISGPEFVGVLVTEGSARYVGYKCCPTETGCSVWIQGDDVTCRDVSTWTAYAVSHCESLGLTAMGIGFHTPC